MDSWVATSARRSARVLSISMDRACCACIHMVVVEVTATRSVICFCKMACLLAMLLVRWAELLILTSGHLTQESLNRCAGTGRHASACETNAGAEANGKAHDDTRKVRAVRPCVRNVRRLCIRRDGGDWGHLRACTVSGHG